MKIVINVKHGGFSLSETAYKRLIELGVPVRAYKEQVRDPETMRFLPEPANDGEVIFDRMLDPVSDRDAVWEAMRRLRGQYWDSWTGSSRAHPLVVRVVEELGAKANGKFADLKVVEIPDGVSWEIQEYDGLEWIAEKHRTWA